MAGRGRVVDEEGRPHVRDGIDSGLPLMLLGPHLLVVIHRRLLDRTGASGLGIECPAVAPAAEGAKVPIGSGVCVPDGSLPGWQG